MAKNISKASNEITSAVNPMKDLQAELIKAMESLKFGLSLMVAAWSKTLTHIDKRLSALEGKIPTTGQQVSNTTQTTSPIQISKQLKFEFGTPDNDADTQSTDPSILDLEAEID